MVFDLVFSVAFAVHSAQSAKWRNRSTRNILVRGFLCAFVAREARRGAAERDAGFVIVACGVKWTPALALAPNLYLIMISVISVQK